MSLRVEPALPRYGCINDPFVAAPQSDLPLFTVQTYFSGPGEVVSSVRLVDFKAKTPLIGMGMVFLAMTIVAITAYLHYGWYSIIGYAIAAAVAVFGFVFTFRDMPAPPHDGKDDAL